MTAFASSSPALICDLVAPDPALARGLAEIVSTCARDLAQPITVRKRTAPPDAIVSGETLLTLHLPASLAVVQHPVWCLACRLACFCPNARVSVLVACETAFRTARRSRHRAA